MPSLTIESGNNRLVKQEKGKADVMVGYHLFDHDDHDGDGHNDDDGDAEDANDDGDGDDDNVLDSKC